jgi:hypothetical protein
MQGIQVGVQALQTKRREGALPVECDHAGEKALQENAYST